MIFVWIYVHGPSDYAKTGRFYELDYSIRSVKKYYRGKSRCIVVGDDPELDVEYIPVERIESSKWGYYRHFDQIKKLKAYLSEVNEDFVLMYDDIYLLNYVSKRDLQQVYAKCAINDVSEYIAERKGDPSYKRCWMNTYNRIREFRDDLWDWETHLPRFYEAEKLNYIIDRYNLTKVDYLAYSLYAAEFSGEPKVIDETVQSKVIEYTPHHTNWERDFSAKFMDTADNGLSGEFIKLMMERF